MSFPMAYLLHALFGAKLPFNHQSNRDSVNPFAGDFRVLLLAYSLGVGKGILLPKEVHTQGLSIPV